jgi:hypothetical protein
MDLHPRSLGGMEKFKQSIASLEKEMAELKAELAIIKGSPPVEGNTHFVAAGQEYGEYSLEELDTFRFKFVVSNGPGNIPHYSYTLTNPIPGISGFSTQYIPIEPDAFESYVMKSTNLGLTTENRKCLESKLWEFAKLADVSKANRNNFTFNTTILIPLTQTYKILPHVSFYVTPFAKADIIVEINEITTKQVTFKISYGNGRTTSDLKLHYAISGISQGEADLL